jgi:hypothetical protein
MFRKPLHLLIGLFLTLLLSAGQAKVLILTSLDDEQNRPPLRSRSWGLNQKLEKIAKKRLQEFDHEIHHHVTQHELFQHLKRSDITALIWVSHSSAGIARGNSAMTTLQIFDYKNRNLAPLFYKLPDQLQFFGLVGCQGQVIYDTWVNDSRIELHHPQNLNLFLEKKKVDARRSLKRAIKQLRSENGLHSEFTEDEFDLDKDEDSTSVMNLTITRSSLNGPATSARLMFEDHLMALFPPLGPEQEQTIEIQINFSIENLAKLKIILESGGGSRETEQLGRLSITTSEGGHWKLFTKPDGTPIGIGTHIYRYQIQDN